MSIEIELCQGIWQKLFSETSVVMTIFFSMGTRCQLTSSLKMNYMIMNHNHEHRDRSLPSHLSKTFFRDKCGDDYLLLHGDEMPTYLFLEDELYDYGS